MIKFKFSRDIKIPWRNPISFKENGLEVNHRKSQDFTVRFCLMIDKNFVLMCKIWKSTCAKKLKRHSYLLIGRIHDIKLPWLLCLINSVLTDMTVLILQCKKHTYYLFTLCYVATSIYAHLLEGMLWFCKYTIEDHVSWQSVWVPLFLLTQSSGISIMNIASIQHFF